MAQKYFGKTKDGHDVEQFELKNKNGVIVKCINYGCRLTNILLPSQSGHDDIILGFDDIGGYEDDDSSQGAFIGRYANRIKGASFSMSGRDYKLLKNDGNNYLHGLLNKRVFAVSAASEGEVVFNAVSKDGEEGFPGELKVTVVYSLDDENKFASTYTATTDADTHVNLTNHTYFDLSLGRDATIENHILNIDSDSFLQTTEDLIPTGKIIDVAGTPFDFTKTKAIGRDIAQDDVNLKIGRGYDHCFLLKDGGRGELNFAAEVRAQDGRRSMKIFTTQPAIQLYTGNFLDGKLKGKGKVLTYRRGFCLETQHYPDTPHHPEFPSTLLKPGEEFSETTVLQFGF
ncbi:aldose 1-epimerase [Synergistales bacterium]|nr:aldose 1-epimerase [Synergistales bacterium]